MKKLLLVLSLSTFTSFALAQLAPEAALKYVPGGVVVQTKKNEVKVKTPKGSIVEIEFDRSGELDDASGDAIENDVFIPGNSKHKKLDEIAAIVKEQGYELKGDWSYDKSIFKGWHYEVDAFKDNQEVELTLDAESGKIVETEINN